MKTSRRWALLGAAAQLLLAGVLAVFVELHGNREPGALPRPLVLLGVFALPGLLGVIAIRRRSAGVLFAAGVASGLGSLLSIATLMFFVPAILMTFGGMAMSEGFSGSRLSLALGVSRAVVVLALVVAAGVSALLFTDERCWISYETSSGVVTEPAPLATGEVAVPDGASGYSCSTGAISARGVGLGSLFGAAGLALAAVHRRRRQPR